MTATRDLKPGWQVLPFAEIAQSITERVDDPAAAGVERYVGLEHLDPDSTWIRRWGSPEDVGSTKLRFHPGDVVYGRRRAYQRKLGVADFEGICSAHALVLRAIPGVCMPEFLPYFLQSDAFHERALGISVGSLSPTINCRALDKEEFALPPLGEQLEIVKQTRLADDALAANAAVPIDQLRASVLKHCCAPTGDRTIADPQPAFESLLLGDVAQLQCEKVRPDADADYRVAGVLNAGKGLFARDDASPSRYPYLHRLSTGQLVMRKLTAWEGPITVVPDEFAGFLVSPEFPTFRLSTEHVVPEYMALLCQRPELWAQMNSASSGTVERRKRVSPTQLLSIRIELPAVEYQQKVVDLLVTLDRVRSSIAAAANDLSDVRRSLIETAWS